MYSQNNEEQIILKYFNGYVGTLLDAGANDGKTFSNSLALIEAGWSAHLFEPSSVYSELVKTHDGNINVTHYNSGVGAVSGALPFYESGSHVPNGNDRGLVSTFDKKELKRWAGVDFIQKVGFIMSFKEWHEKHNYPTLDFITIDIEGKDLELLKAIDLTAVGCKCLCIEWNGRRDLERLFTQYCATHNMTEIHRNGENLIFAV